MLWLFAIAWQFYMNTLVARNLNAVIYKYSPAVNSILQFYTHFCCKVQMVKDSDK